MVGITKSKYDVACWPRLWKDNVRASIKFEIPWLISYRENGQFTEMQVKALMFYVSVTRPDVISLYSNLEHAVSYFLTYNQLLARPSPDDIRIMIGIHNSTIEIVD